MFEIKKKYKVLIVIITLVIVYIIIFMPFIINKIYNMEPPSEYYNIDYEKSNLLDYYGSILVFIGTTTLGFISIYQTYANQRKTEQVNKLTLELQLEAMRVAEERYKTEKVEGELRITPRFEIKLKSYNGFYVNISAQIKNLSEGLISGLKTLEFKIYGDEQNVLVTSDKVNLEKESLGVGEDTEIKFNNNENLFKTTPKTNGILIYWVFSCKDVRGNIHYYQAEKYIKDSTEFDGEAWNVIKKG